MTRPVLLNNVDHHALRVDTARSAALGDAVMYALTFPSEFRNLQAHYPIVFHKAADGSFQALALFGLRERQNLFLEASPQERDTGTGERWDATYVPLTIQRQPFLIGVADDELTVNIDLDSPRIGTAAGTPVFLEHGGNTEFLEHMKSLLLALHEGLQAVPAFIAALLQHGLLESFVLDVELDDGAQHRLAGFYAIDEERLRRLDGDALASLHRSGHLEAVYMAIASQSNFRALIERMNRSHAAHA